VESLRGELKWTDIDTFASQEIKRGIRRGRLIDVCSSWEQQRVLKPETVRGGRGYCFSEPGTYTFEISAEGDKWASAGRLSLDVYFDGENWASLRPVSARERVQWFRLWRLIRTATAIATPHTSAGAASLCARAGWSEGEPLAIGRAGHQSCAFAI